MEKHNSILNPDKFRAAVFDNLASEDVGYSNYSYWKSTFRTFFKSKMVCLLVFLVGAIILMSFLYPLFTSTDPTKVSLMLSLVTVGALQAYSKVIASLGAIPAPMVYCEPNLAFLMVFTVPVPLSSDIPTTVYTLK